MLSNLFLGLSLVGAEWVLYLLIILSILSVTLMIERARYYKQASKGLGEFRRLVRESISQGRTENLIEIASTRRKGQTVALDLETEMVHALVSHSRSKAPHTTDVMNELASDAVMRARLGWERNLSVLATIGNNAPFVGLFGTVLGIIKAFHDLSQQPTGAQTISSGISESLVATAVGLLVAIPAVIAFNIFQRRVKSALTEAEALKSYVVGKLAE